MPQRDDGRRVAPAYSPTRRRHVTILKTPGVITKIIRDYMYDFPSPRAVTTILDDVTAIRSGRAISAGAVRRALNILVGNGALILDDKARPPLYQWNPVEPKPGDYLHRALPQGIPTITTTTTKGSSVSTPTMTGDDKRASLQQMIQGRMDEITGTRKNPQEEEPVKPKRNPAKGITRANGQVYQPRGLAGRSDVEALRMLRDKGIFPLLAGPPGTGKTALVDAAFGKAAGRLHTVTADENTSVDDFLGQWSPDGHGGYVWVDGPLINAMRSGGVLFIDDATLANPKVLAVVYPAMDGRGEVTVKSHIVEGKPDVVKSQPGFFVVAAHNPGVHGAILTDALASRFVARIWVETDLVLAASLGVTDRFISLVKKLRVEREKGQQSLWIPQLRELLAARDMAAVFGEKVAAANLLGVAPEEDQTEVQDKMRIVFNEEILPLEIGGQL
jgi:nitric oxide reductase NorQ protein